MFLVGSLCFFRVIEEKDLEKKSAKIICNINATTSPDSEINRMEKK
jgi:hypothetical protein